MTSSHSEIIGYVERSELDTRCSLPEAGVLRDPSACLYHELIGLLTWAQRGPLEEDPRKKQLIPYVIVTRGEKVWVMRRKRAQSEARLHDKLSLGVGGHLDASERHAEDPVMGGALREFGEEVVCHGEALADAQWRYIGLLNDDRNDVGQVHLGVVFQVTLSDEQDLTIREHDKLEGAWTCWSDLEMERLETWSQLIVEVMKA